MNPKVNELSFFEHLDELRFRLIKSAVAVVVAACFFYSFIDSARGAGRLYLALRRLCRAHHAGGVRRRCAGLSYHPLSNLGIRVRGAEGAREKVRLLFWAVFAVVVCSRRVVRLFYYDPDFGQVPVELLNGADRADDHATELYIVRRDAGVGLWCCFRIAAGVDVFDKDRGRDASIPVRKKAPRRCFDPYRQRRPHAAGRGDAAYHGRAAVGFVRAGDPDLKDCLQKRERMIFLPRAQGERRGRRFYFDTGRGILAAGVRKKYRKNKS